MRQGRETEVDSRESGIATVIPLGQRRPARTPPDSLKASPGKGIQRALFSLGEHMESLDGTPLATALAYAIAVLDGLPEPLPERHALDRNKMVEILEVMIPNGVERERYAEQAERVVGRLPDFTDWRPRQ